MTTLADIHRAAETTVSTAVDDTTPAGHFTATAKILGLTTTYLLAGAENDPQATIVGRIEYQPMERFVTAMPVAYRGGGIKGGTLLLGIGDFAVAFQSML